MEGQDGKGVPGTTGRFFSAARVPSPPRAHSTEGVAEAQTRGFVIRTSLGAKHLRPEAVSSLRPGRERPLTPSPLPQPYCLKLAFPTAPGREKKAEETDPQQAQDMFTE